MLCTSNVTCRAKSVSTRNACARLAPQCTQLQAPKSAPRCVSKQPDCQLTSTRLALASLAGWLTVLAASPALAKPSPALNQEVDAANSPLIQRLLKNSTDNKAKYDKERLDSFYRRNYKDFFEVEASDIKAGRARGLSPETQKEILQWLEANK